GAGLSRHCPPPVGCPSRSQIRRRWTRLGDAVLPGGRRLANVRDRALVAAGDPTEMGLGFSSGRRFREGHLVAERGEPLRVVAGEALGIEVVEVVAPELAIRRAVAQYVVRDHQDAVGHRDDGLLVPAALDQPPVLGREVAVTFEDGARALSTRAWRRTRFAKRVRPLRRLPALS